MRLQPQAVVLLFNRGVALVLFQNFLNGFEAFSRHGSQWNSVGCVHCIKAIQATGGQRNCDGCEVAGYVKCPFNPAAR